MSTYPMNRGRSDRGIYKRSLNLSQRNSRSKSSSQKCTYYISDDNKTNLGWEIGDERVDPLYTIRKRKAIEQANSADNQSDFFKRIRLGTNSFTAPTSRVDNTQKPQAWNGNYKTWNKSKQEGGYGTGAGYNNHSQANGISRKPVNGVVESNYTLDEHAESSKKIEPKQSEPPNDKVTNESKDEDPKAKASINSKDKTKDKAKSKSKGKARTKSKTKSKVNAKTKDKTKGKAKYEIKAKNKAKDNTKDKAKDKAKDRAKDKNKNKAKVKNRIKETDKAKIKAKNEIKVNSKGKVKDKKKDKNKAKVKNRTKETSKTKVKTKGENKTKVKNKTKDKTKDKTKAKHKISIKDKARDKEIDIDLVKYKAKYKAKYKTKYDIKDKLADKAKHKHKDKVKKARVNKTRKTKSKR